MQYTIAYKNATVAYQVFGTGKETLLAFHGYGKEASSLAILANHVGSKFTIVSVDIFFHGDSIWADESAPSQDDWKAIVDLLLEAVDSPPKFSVFGYSIGGQVATCTAWLFGERINTLWLMAATGIGNDGFYYMAVNTAMGNQVFKAFVKKQKLISRPLHWLTTLKILPKNLEVFVNRKIDTPEKRELLYQRWQVLKNFGVYTNQLKKRLNANNSHTLLVYGKTDAVVKHKAAKRFAKGINNVTLLLPDIGHHLITDEIVKEAAENL